MSQRYQLGQTATLPRRADVQVLRALQQFQKANFDEIIRHPVPLDMNTLKALKRSSLGIDFYLWLTYRNFTLKRPLRLSWASLYRQFGAHPDKASDRFTVHAFRYKVLRELEKIKLAWPELNYSTAKGVLILSPSESAIPPTRQLRLQEEENR